jgi:photosystem II stability/assembly factor-like uncharacterized protein
METLAERYARLREEMDELYEGSTASAAAAQVLAVLPGGPVTLLSTSDQGLGIAAICASRRSSTTWRKTNLVSPLPAPTIGAVVVIEPVDAGSGWREAVEHRYPGAQIVIVNELRPARLAAA